MPNNVLGIDGSSGKATITAIKKENDTNSTGIKTPTVTTDAKDSNTKALNAIETAIVEKYIEGSLTVIPTHKLRKGMILYLSNLGAMFEGKYYVKRVNMSMSATSFTVTAEVIRISDKIEKKVTSRVEVINFITPLVSSSPNYKTITIAWGDTLTKLAKQYKSTVQELASINKIANPDKIYAGKTLKVPVR